MYLDRLTFKFIKGFQLMIMKSKTYILMVLLMSFGIIHSSYAQVDFNKRPDDDLGNVEDQFQELFFEALKQKGIENYQRSIDALIKCIDLDDSDPVLYYELGKNYIELKNYGDAEDALKEAVSKDPENEWYLDALYKVYIEQDDMNRALKTAKQLVKFHPDYKQDLASLYIKAKEYDKAIEVLDEMDKNYGYSKDRDYLRNQIYDLTGNTEERIEKLEERVATNPEDEANYLRLIYRYSQNGDKEKAFKTARELLIANPSSELVHLALYKFYLDGNDPENAIKSMKIALRSPQINPEAKTKVLNDFVTFVSNNPQYEKDLIEITALVGEEKSVETLLDLGRYHLKLNDKEKALMYFEEALAKEPTNFLVMKDVLLLQTELNQNEEAIALSSEALELFPAQPLLYLLQGVSYNKLEQGKKAIEALETGLDYVLDNPTMEADYYKQLSISYKLINDISKSESFTKKAEALKQQ